MAPLRDAGTTSEPAAGDDDGAAHEAAGHDPARAPQSRAPAAHAVRR
jgi:hypothetical protein